ncbi:helix-turn-helix transcriptional regulator [Brevibacterium sp. Mu109]|uniref:helix-turn-helix transcriptional regulator n=1 Tax=Brevibacterium sp. Mu109 TaxID=1255669 RepID=UPI001122740B|nr:AraC family transcriptional regulator [Brevibacterium sp. Mu109]
MVTPTALAIPRREVRVIVAAFRRDLARPWSMARLSRQANLSTSQLTRAFNSAYGVSPMRLLARLRVEGLAELLQTTNWTVQECAAAVGWHDADHAAKMMKHIYGITPSEFRKAARSSPW